MSSLPHNRILYTHIRSVHRTDESAGRSDASTVMGCQEKGRLRQEGSGFGSPSEAIREQFRQCAYLDRRCVMQRRKRGALLLKEETPSILQPFEEIGRRFEDFFRRPFSTMGPPWSAGAEIPAVRESALCVDIYEEKGDVVVKAEMPGMKKEEISVELAEDRISIAGEKKREESVERKDYCRIERAYGAFARSYPLPVPVQTEKAKARYQNGVLEVRIPKTEEARRKIRAVAIG